MPVTMPTSTTNQEPERDVLISGAGIAGLTLALALAKHNISAHVFDKRNHFEPEGAGIQIGPNGARILDALGIGDYVRAKAGTPRYVRVRDGISGLSLADMPIGQASNPAHTAPYCTIHRSDLHAALLTAVKNTLLVKISLGHEVRDCSQSDDEATFEFAEQAPVRGRMAVAADGIHSILRPRVAGDVRVIPVGKSAARTVIPQKNKPETMTGDDVGLWLAPHAHVVHYTVNKGRDFALVAIFEDDDIQTDWSTDIPMDWVLSRSQSLHPDLQRLLKAGQTWKKWSLASTPPLDRWSLGRLALIGDAAHTILPFLAQGAVMALEDAYVLSGLVAEHLDDPVSAFAAYEQQRKSRTTRVAKAAAFNGKVYHQAGMYRHVRNSIMRTAGGARLMQSYNWLYNWGA